MIDTTYLTPKEVTLMISILIDDAYKSEVEVLDEQYYIEKTPEEWKGDKFDETLQRAREQI